MIKDFVRWLYWYPFRFLIKLVPLKTSYGFAKIVSFAMFRFSSKSRAIRHELDLLINGCAHIEGSDDPENIVRETLYNDFCKELEVLKFPTLNAGNIEEIVKCEGLENIDKALECGRGVILIFGHLGANQMIMPALGYRGYKINQVGAPPQVLIDVLTGEDMPPILRKSLDIRWELEKTLPAEIIDFQRSMRSAFKCLKRNELLGFAIDGGAGDNRREFRFLGQDMRFSLGVIDVAMRTGAVLLPTFVVRDRDGLNRMIVETPLEICPGETRDSIIGHTAEAMLKKLEDYVCRYPSHYLSFLAFMKRVPFHP